MNATAQPEIARDACGLCGECLAACPTEALSIVAGRLEIVLEQCGYCGDCEDVCPKGAIRLPYQIVVVTEDSAD